MNSRNLPPLTVPALRAYMGNWIYYICSLRIEDIVARISTADEIHVSKSLEDLLQRTVTDRSEGIKDYLLTQPQRFFNALVVGTYGGDPEWYELDIQKDTSNSVGSYTIGELPDYVEGSIGLLQLSGSETLFAIDGQHRVAGMREALMVDKTLGREEVCAVFVQGVTKAHRDDDPEGFESTRRLFTTLNRHAKPVSKKDIIALDEDDTVAITTRYVVEREPLFHDKVALTNSRSISVADKQNITTIVTLYDALDIHLRNRGPTAWKNYKTLRPAEVDLEYFAEQSYILCNVLSDQFPVLQDVIGRASEGLENIIGEYRNQNTGGHLIFRPVGFLILVRASRILVDCGLSLRESFARLAEAPQELNSELWSGLLWDPTNKLMLTDKKRQTTSAKLLLQATASDVDALSLDVNKLRKELAGLLNREECEITLPNYT